MDPWAIACAGALAFAAYEYYEYQNSSNTTSVPAPGPPRYNTSTYVNTQENPWDKNEKLHVTHVSPSDPIMFQRHDLSGKWDLHLPTGSIMSVYSSYNKLCQKVVMTQKCY